MRYVEYTSESVSDGHPDKIADQISDAILDHILSGDPMARVACEVLVKDRLVVISGEVSTTVDIDYMSIVTRVMSSIYHRPVNPDEIELLVHVGKQSPEIAHGVDHRSWIGAGDQGMMFGYACDETSAYLPMPIYWAHELMIAHKEWRKQNTEIQSDAKSQVTVVYQDNQPLFIKNVVLSTQHTEALSLEDVRKQVQKELIDKVLPHELFADDIKYFVNPSGSFVRGGPSADCGLTGRKIMVDTYGGMALHGGGAFSGKDATKVDRTAAYMARYVAKHIVAAGLAKRCLVQLAYAIGIETPVMIEINTFGTNTTSEKLILDKIKSVFSFRPRDMIERLGLTRPVFQKTATFGHFGRTDGFSWENLDSLDAF